MKRIILPAPKPAQISRAKIRAAIMAVMKEAHLEDTALELWAAAQLLPEEGIEDGVSRIVEILRRAQ